HSQEGLRVFGWGHDLNQTPKTDRFWERLLKNREDAIAVFHGNRLEYPPLLTARPSWNQTELSLGVQPNSMTRTLDPIFTVFLILRL
ncbi:MAG TPA: hypothetical protein VGJ97_02715, partial [Anaerolineaceae bacterium]